MSKDTIYRQDAIDAMEQAKEQYFDRRVIIGKMQDIVNNLPSAQPEVLAHGEGELSAQPEQQWIPVSERLPEASGRYLISVLDGVWRRTTVALYQRRYKAWAMTGRMAYWKVVAWMPLPEPYEGSEK